jgi:hypothetical protein
MDAEGMHLDSTPGCKEGAMSDDTPMDNDGEARWYETHGREQLQLLYEQRSSQDSILWTVYGAFWATNAILVVALFSSGRLTADWRAAYLVPFVAYLDAAAWVVIQNRALRIIRKLEIAASAMEDRLYIPVEFRVSRSRNGRHLIRGTMRLMSMMVTLAWAVAAFFADFWLALGH